MATIVSPLRPMSVNDIRVSLLSLVNIVVVVIGQTSTIPILSDNHTTDQSTSESF